MEPDRPVVASRDYGRRRHLSVGRRPGAPRPDNDGPSDFDRFYIAHHDRISRAVGLTVGDVHLASDATSEAMIKAHLRWGEVSGYANPSGWVYRVALNHARGWRRTALRRRTSPGDVPDALATADEEPTDPQIMEALAQLSLPLRAVVVCRLFLDWSVDQTAEALDIAPGTVKSRLARGLDQLRATLGEVER